MRKELLENTSISSTVILADNTIDPIAQISVMFNDGIKIAEVKLEGEEKTNLYIPIKVVNASDYDPTIASDSIIYFIRK